VIGSPGSQVAGAGVMTSLHLGMLYSCFRWVTKCKRLAR
jgi:hypothetical protein